MSQLVKTEVNSGNRKAVLALDYATRIRGHHAALRECIMYKQLVVIKDYRVRSTALSCAIVRPAA